MDVCNHSNKNITLTDKQWKLINFCEFDKYAIKSYCQIHGVDESLNLGDITKVDEKAIDDFNFMSWGFPCTDISLAGKQAGFIDENGNKTRSGMYYEGIRILREKKPKISIIENVRALVSKKFTKEFEMVLNDLEEAGYNNYWKILNSKNFGIPQNRERVFIVSIRKDVDNGKFKFPEGFELELRLKDMLEAKVDEKYYLSDKMMQYISNTGTKNFSNNDSKINLDVARPLTTDQNKRAGTTNYISEDLPDNFDLKAIRKYGIFDTEKSKHQAGGVWDTDGLSPTLDTMQGGWRTPCIEETVEEIKGKSYMRNFGSKGKLQDPDGECTTLLSAMGSGGGNVPIVPVNDDLEHVQSEPKIIKTDIKFPVKVRKYKVDCASLCELLRDHKGSLTNKEISERLNVPITKVEHWFRRDSSFAIPDAEIWYQLKELLGIENNEFDEAVTTFEERDGVYEKSNRCYHEEGIAPTLTSTSADEKVIVSEPNNKPYVEIKEATKKGYKEAYEGDGVYLDRPHQKRGCVQHDMIQTIKTNGNDIGVVVRDHDEVKIKLRIRKLTPRECFRLMGFKDEHFDRIQKISNTQLYKQAGNSIVTDVLFYIYKELYVAMPYLFDDLKVSSFFSGIGAFEVALDRLYGEVINQQ